MAPLPLEKIAELCRRHGAIRLEAFGSATTEQFGAASDYDFFVEFDENARRRLAPFLGLKAALEDLLGRSVDLVERSAVINKTFLRTTEHDRRLVYAA